jgi:fibronectin type 3 domain-containing protein
VLFALSVGLTACDSGGSGNEPDPEPQPGDELEAPAAPSGLEATSQDGAAELRWDDVDEADSFVLYRDTEAGVDASGSPLETGISGTSFTDETAENGTTYYYVVTAVASGGGEAAESDPSEEVEVTPFSDPPDRP